MSRTSTTAKVVSPPLPRMSQIVSQNYGTIPLVAVAPKKATKPRAPAPAPPSGSLGTSTGDTSPLSSGEWLRLAESSRRIHKPTSPVPTPPGYNGAPDADDTSNNYGTVPWPVQAGPDYAKTNASVAGGSHGGLSDEYGTVPLRVQGPDGYASATASAASPLHGSGGDQGVSDEYGTVPVKGQPPAGYVSASARAATEATWSGGVEQGVSDEYGTVPMKAHVQSGYGGVTNFHETTAAFAHEHGEDGSEDGRRHDVVPASTSNEYGTVPMPEQPPAGYVSMAGTRDSGLVIVWDDDNPHDATYGSMPPPPQAHPSMTLSLSDSSSSLAKVITPSLSSSPTPSPRDHPMAQASLPRPSQPISVAPLSPLSPLLADAGLTPSGRRRGCPPPLPPSPPLSPEKAKPSLAPPDF